MILLDLLEIIDEGNNIKLIEYLTNNILGIYENKELIDEKYIFLKVISINSSVENGRNFIEITMNNN